MASAEHIEHISMARDKARAPVAYLLRAYQAKIEEQELTIAALEQELFEAALEIEELEER